MPESRRKRPREAKQAPPLSRAKNLVRGNLNKAEALGRARGLVGAGDMPELARWALSTLARSVPINGLHASRLEDLHHPIFLPPNPIAEEIAWATTLLVAHSDILKAHIQLSRRLLVAVLHGNEQECFECLNEMERCCGFSLFAVAQRIALLQMFGKTELQREYVATLRALPKGTALNFYGYWWNSRAEDVGSPGARLIPFRQVAQNLV